MFNTITDYFFDTFRNSEFIPLHEPRFIGNEKKYLQECIETNSVSSIGDFVDKVEDKISKYLGVNHAILTVNGTAALHLSLILANVNQNDEVITQPLTFVATCNAIQYCKAQPIFIDVDKETMGMSPKSLISFLEKNTFIKDNKCINKITNKIIRACLPMHTYGHPCKIDLIKKICDEHCIVLIEDAAESLGSTYKKKFSGTFGQLGIISFNGNKIITAGGGGCIITNDLNLAKKAKHLATTARIPHDWNYIHDDHGYNYRMPNLNAALLFAQLERLEEFIENKRKLAKRYEIFFKSINIDFFTEPSDARSNYWLNCIFLNDKEQRNQFLEYTNLKGIMTRPAWKLINELEIFNNCQTMNLKNSKFLADRIVNIPSSVRVK